MRASSQLNLLSKLIGFAVLVFKSNSLSLSWRTVRRTVPVSRSSNVLPSSFIRTDVMLKMTMYSPSTTCSDRNRCGKLLSRMSLSTGKEEGTKRPVDTEKYSGLKNAIMMGTPLFLKFFIVMIVKFVKDVTIFPTIYMIKFIKKAVAVVSKKNSVSSEEDLDLTRKVIMGGPGTKL